jgi:hypothetical protein
VLTKVSEGQGAADASGRDKIKSIAAIDRVPLTPPALGLTDGLPFVDPEDHLSEVHGEEPGAPSPVLVSGPAR